MSKKQAAPGTGKKARREAAKAAGMGTGAPTTTHVQVDKEIKQPEQTKAAVEGGMPPLPKMPKLGGNKERQPKPQKDCTCGCGGKTTGAWVPGHDARARGWAIRIERGILTMNDVPANERAGAKFMLADRAEKGLTGKGIHLAKGKSVGGQEQAAGERSPELKAIDEQVEAAIKDGMSVEAAEGLRASLEAGLQAASGQ